MDLSSWTQVVYNHPANGQPDAKWVIEHDNQWAVQKVNGDPSILVSDVDVADLIVIGTWEMTGNADDDFVGFVFGYQDPGHFYLLDWKKETQDDGDVGLAKQGICLKMVSIPYDGPGSGVLPAGVPFDGHDLWATEGVDGRVTLIHHEPTAGWEFDKEYHFELNFKPGAFSVSIRDDETTVFNKTFRDRTYEAGKFGFYNFSQAPVTYRGFKTTTVIPPPFPWWILIVVLLIVAVLIVVLKRRSSDKG